jgi:hypothetical protein
VAALAVLVLLAAGCGSTPVPTEVPAAATASERAGPSPTEAPTTASTPTPTATPVLVPLVPVTGFWSDRVSISRADLASALAGTAASGAGDGSLLVSDADLVPLAAALGVAPGVGVRALPAADVTAALATTPGAIGVIRAADVGPGVHALEVDGLSLFGEHRIADPATWPLLVPEAPGTASAFDAASLWTLAAGGDVMLDRWPYRRAVLDGLGPDYPWAGGTAVVTSRYCCGWPGLRLANGKSTGGAGAFASLFRDADVGLVNLEGPAPDAFSYHQGTLLFTMDPTLLAGIAHAGIDVVSLANNHIYNAGAKGVTDTIRNLNAAGIGHMGAGVNASAARAPAWLTAGGLRIAILGYNGVDTSFDATATKAGAALLAEDAMVADVRAARAAGADVVVVVPHWGVEYTDVVSAAQRRLARAAIAAGADVILGSHSHWAGPLEIVDGHLVVYSFGDLVFDLGHDERTQEAMVAELTFAGRRLVQVTLHPTLILDRSQPNLLEPAGGGTALMAAIAAGSARLTP